MVMQERVKTPVELALEIFPVLKKQLEDEAMCECEQVEILFLLMQLVAGPFVTLTILDAMTQMNMGKSKNDC